MAINHFRILDISREKPWERGWHLRLMREVLSNANYSGNFFFNDFPTHARSLQASSSPIRRITKWFILNEVMRKLQSELDEPSECTPLETIFLLFKSATVAPWAEILRSALGRFLHDVPSPHNRTGGK